MKAEIKVAMAEDHLIVRQGLISMLKGHKNIKVLFDVNNGQELLNQLATRSPDIVLLDIDMPVMDGRETLRRLNAGHPSIKVIMLTQHFSDAFIVEFLKMGAKSFLPKDSSFDEIVASIYMVHTKGCYYSERITKALASELSNDQKQSFAFPPTKFTRRELQILELLRQNKDNSDISRILAIRERTVEWHRQNLMQKSECKNLAALISYATEKGLIPQSQHS